MDGCEDDTSIQYRILLLLYTSHIKADTYIHNNKDKEEGTVFFIKVFFFLACKCSDEDFLRQNVANESKNNYLILSRMQNGRICLKCVDVLFMYRRIMQVSIV